MKTKGRFLMILFKEKNPLGMTVVLHDYTYRDHIRARKPSKLCPDVREIQASIGHPSAIYQSRIQSDAYWHCAPAAARPSDGGKACYTLSVVKPERVSGAMSPEDGRYVVATAVHTPQDGSSKGLAIWPKAQGAGAP
jgi:hypothetical protein